MQKCGGEVSLGWPLGRLREGRENEWGLGECEWKDEVAFEVEKDLQFLEKCPKFKYFGLVWKFYQKSRKIFEDQW